MMPPTAYGRTSATLRSTTKSIPDASARYTGRPSASPRNPRRPRSIPSTEYSSGRFGKMSNVIVPSWTPSGPAPMNVIRSTHSSRLSRLPRRSIRSSYGTSTFVTVGADIAPPFIQYRGLVWDSGVRPLGLGPSISATKVQVTPRSPVANQGRAGHTCKTDGRGGGRSMDGQQTIGIAGVGKMGEALVRGLLVGRVVPPTRILVSDAVPSRAKEVAARHGVGHTDSIGELAAKSDVLFLAAKPKDMAALIDGIATQIKRDSLVITLAAGVRTAFVEKVLAGRGRAVRIMPNLPCAVGEGATAFALGKTATEHDALTLEEIFGAIGRVTMVEERMLDAVTGLSGSGPGFIAALAHSMIEGGARSGLPRDVAYKLVLQTMKGTAELLLIDGLEPMQLFRMVATPNGTTEAGWKVMEQRGVPSAISDAIVAASTRAAELAAEVAKVHK